MSRRQVVVDVVDGVEVVDDESDGAVVVVDDVVVEDGGVFDAGLSGTANSHVPVAQAVGGVAVTAYTPGVPTRAVTESAGADSRHSRAGSLVTNPESCPDTGVDDAAASAAGFTGVRVTATPFHVAA